MSQPQLQILEFEPVKIAVLEAGSPDDPLAICLHGFPDTASSWIDTIDRLAKKGFHAIAPFQRGYHPSSVASDGCYDIAALIWDAVRVYEHYQGDNRTVIVGHDWGAEVVYGLLSLMPNRFRKAVTLSVPPTHGVSIDTATPAQMHRSWYAFMFAFDWAIDLVREHNFALIDLLWKEWAPQLDAGEYLLAVKASLAARENTVAALAYYRDAAIYKDLPTRYQSIRDAIRQPINTPTLYLHGLDDGCIDPDLIHFAAKYLPHGSSWKMLEGIGHFPHLEAPERFHSLLDDWFST
jgi:pimeloyl-ACP methyl ester carboxylesterase